MRMEFKDTCVSLGGKEILRNVSLLAQPGKMTGIVGPNGCGKSTLLKTVFGIVPKQSGTLFINGKNAAQMSKKEISSMIGYVGQDAACSFDFSVYDVVEMALYNRKDKKKSSKIIVKEALEELHISHMADRNIQTLSGGEKKMVFMARAIAQGVDTIILDEPTNHLDIKHQLFILNYLKRSGKTILIVLHDLRLAVHYCDELFVLKNGKNLYNGAPLEVLTPEHVHQVFEVEGKAYFDNYGKLDFYLGMDACEE